MDSEKKSNNPDSLESENMTKPDYIIICKQ